MVSIKQRRVIPVTSGNRTFHELQDASTFLGKQRVVPTSQNLKKAHKTDDVKSQRRGQLVDILV
jgi:hypothetical protein